MQSFFAWNEIVLFLILVFVITFPSFSLPTSDGCRFMSLQIWLVMIP